VIRHLVLWKLADPDADRAAVAADLVERFGALVPIVDGLDRLDIRHDLGEVDGNWDLALDADYRDNAALEAYQVHPAHQEVAAYVRSLVSARACIDFEV
jgi:hypothetical protein